MVILFSCGDFLDWMFFRLQLFKKLVQECLRCVSETCRRVCLRHFKLSTYSCESRLQADMSFSRWQSWMQNTFDLNDLQPGIHFALFVDQVSFRSEGGAWCVVMLITHVLWRGQCYQKSLRPPYTNKGFAERNLFQLSILHHNRLQYWCCTWCFSKASKSCSRTRFAKKPLSEFNCSLNWGLFLWCPFFRCLLEASDLAFVFSQELLDLQFAPRFCKMSKPKVSRGVRNQNRVNYCVQLELGM